MFYMICILVSSKSVIAKANSILKSKEFSRKTKIAFGMFIQNRHLSISQAREIIGHAQFIT